MSNRQSLSHRFALIIFSVGLLLVIPLVGLQTHIARHALQQRIQSSSEVIAEALESLARAHITDKDIALLRTELQQIVEQNRFAYVDVYDPDGHAVIQVNHPQHPHGNFREPDIQNVRDNVLDVSRLLRYPDDRTGRIDVGIWVQGIDRDTRQIAINGIEMGLVLCICLALLSWGLGRWLSNRLRTFANSLTARTPQDYGHLDLRGSDEVGALVESFNNLQDRLKESQERRDRAERERQDMTHMLIHDLKGPLGSFSAGLDLLEDSVAASQDPSQTQLLHLMKRASERLLRMTQSILQLGRLEDPTYILISKPVEIASLVASRVEEADPMARDLGIALRLSADADLPPIQGDPEVLGRVIDNLIFNALEHTPHGGQVQVSIRLSHGQIQVGVQDTGPGIPPDQRQIIFEKFRKGATSKGVGLGLAFSKRAIERHGGRIGVKDAPGGGAMFYFKLPGESAAVSVR